MPWAFGTKIPRGVTHNPVSGLHCAINDLNTPPPCLHTMIQTGKGGKLGWKGDKDKMGTERHGGRGDAADGSGREWEAFGERWRRWRADVFGSSSPTRTIDHQPLPGHTHSPSTPTPLHSSWRIQRHFPTGKVDAWISKDFVVILGYGQTGNRLCFYTPFAPTHSQILP